jgi:hypothetical protein
MSANRRAWTFRVATFLLIPAIILIATLHH